VPEPTNTAGHCPGVTKAGAPCQMKPTADGWCMQHSPHRVEQRQASTKKGGSVRQAQKALVRARQEAIEKFGITEPIPDMADIEACRHFLVAVAGKVLQGSLSPAAANALSTIVRVSKELLSLEVDVKLAAQLDALDAKERRP
jgi:hypothetical protein